MESFEEIGLSGTIQKAINDLGFEKPTPIQAKAIPLLLSSDQDVIASAQTGTGKTGAFGLPLLHMTDVDDSSTQGLVLCPTRELCLQITKDLQQFGKYIKGLNIVAVYGGASIRDQIRALNKGAQIVVATPGRAKDLLSRKRLILDDVKRVVLDEADEMLTMGFKDELDAILGAMPEEKQILLFSATMSKRIRSITKTYMDDPVQIETERVNTAAKNVEHVYYVVHSRDRYEVIKRIADINPNIYAIIFCRTRRETKEVAANLMQDGYGADALHGDLSQSQRDEVMDKFRQRQLQILVATDVASRGLDVTELTHVINFNLPDDIEVYVHRSGRTGRAGNHGTSIAIVTKRELQRIRMIERISSLKFKKSMVPTGQEVCSKQLLALVDRIEKISVDEEKLSPFMDTVYEKLASLDREQLIKHFVSSEFNRFLDYYKGARDLNADSKKKKEERRNRRSKFIRLYINVGAKNFLTPHRLIGVINEALDSSDSAIGKIEIMRNFSFFEIEEGMHETLISSLRGQVFEGVELMVEASQYKSKSADRDRERGRGGRRDYGRSSDRRRSGGGSRDRDRGDRRRFKDRDFENKKGKGGRGKKRGKHKFAK